MFLHYYCTVIWFPACEKTVQSVRRIQSSESVSFRPFVLEAFKKGSEVFKAGTGGKEAHKYSTYQTSSDELGHRLRTQPQVSDNINNFYLHTNYSNPFIFALFSHIHIHNSV